MKRIATINCSNCNGKVSIYDNGSYKTVGVHTHNIEEGKIPELRGLSTEDKICLLGVLYKYDGWGLDTY